MLTPPAAFYIDSSRLEHERDSVFARSWQLVGRVAQPGDDRLFHCWMGAAE